MAVLNYDIQINVASHHAILTKIKDFALAQGWSILNYLENVQWAWTGTQYDFVAGDEYFLEIQSSGFGNQILHYRFRSLIPSDPTDAKIEVSAQHGEAIDHSSSLHPIYQNDWATVSSGAYRRFSFLGTTIPKVYLFGNVWFIAVAAQISNNYCNFMAVGSLELTDTSLSEGNYCCRGNGAKWDATLSCFDYLNGSWIGVYLDAGGRIADTNIRFSTNNAWYGGAGMRYARALVKNSWSIVRPVAQPTVYVKNAAGLWQSIGYLPIYRMNTLNLQIGEELKYGNDRYICFPNTRRLTEYKGGVAFRVA